MGRPRGEVTAATELKLEQIVRLQLMDKSTEDIAQELGVVPYTVSELIRSRHYREVRDRVVGQIYGPIDTKIQERKASTILEESAPEAAGALVELLQRRKGRKDAKGEWEELPLDPVDIRLVASAVLDRAGYGPVQRRAIKQRIEMDPITARIFASAMAEADRGRGVVEGEVVEGDE